MNIDFMKDRLMQLAPEHGVPEELIEQLVHLMNEHPNVKEFGAKTRLREGMEKIIENAIMEGK